MSVRIRVVEAIILIALFRDTRARTVAFVLTKAITAWTSV